MATSSKQVIIKIDDEIKIFLDKHKIIKEEPYYKVLKRIFGFAVTAGLKEVKSNG